MKPCEPLSKDPSKPPNAPIARQPGPNLGDDFPDFFLRLFFRRGSDHKKRSRKIVGKIVAQFRENCWRLRPLSRPLPAWRRSSATCLGSHGGFHRKWWVARGRTTGSRCFPNARLFAEAGHWKRGQIMDTRSPLAGSTMILTEARPGRNDDKKKDRFLREKLFFGMVSAVCIPCDACPWGSLLKSSQLANLCCLLLLGIHGACPLLVSEEGIQNIHTWFQI